MAGPIVRVREGQIQGRTLKTKSGKEYHSFSGIPYAEPPIGKLRFKEPVPIGPWNGIRDATFEGPAAMQDPKFGIHYNSSEDCLFLNVHTPIINTLLLLPVMLFIHGGGFIAGSGSTQTFGPDYLIEQDVVMVNFNYRLGVFGFLCTDSVNATGDMGLKDQNLAMKWVKENIKSFGGDPDRVTLFGVSAGAASVEYHILSSKSKNLFNRAIIQSGSALNPWARLKGGVEYAERFAKKLGYDSSKGQGLFDFINGFDGETLVDHAGKMLEEHDFKEGRYFSFVPVVNELEGYDGFLNEEPLEIIRKGKFNKVPVISGMCNKEGYLFDWLLRDVDTKQYFDTGNFLEYVPEYIKSKNQNLNTDLKKLYFKDDKKESTIDFISDLYFNGGILYSLEQRLKHGNREFFYSFVYEGESNLGKRFLNLTYTGASHGDDILYISSYTLINIGEMNAKDTIVKDRMVKMWTDFAKIGNPTPKMTDLINTIWEPANKNDFKYLEIGENMTLYKNNYTPDRRNLWLDIYNQLDK